MQILAAGSVACCCRDATWTSTHTHTRADHIALNWVFGYSKVAQSDESWRRHPNIQTSKHPFPLPFLPVAPLVAASWRRPSLHFCFCCTRLFTQLARQGRDGAPERGTDVTANLQRRPFCSFPLIVQCPLAVCFLFLSSWNCLTHLQSIGRPLELL